MELTSCPGPKNGGIKSIKLYQNIYNKSDIKDGKLKRKYGKFDRKPVGLQNIDDENDIITIKNV